MICKEDIAVWFKGLEGDERIELMCSLLDCCLPLELRFLGTYIEYAANKHYSNLQRYERTANDATFGQLKNLHDSTIRRKFCIYLALLYSHNKKAATDLFKFLEHFDPDECVSGKDDSLSVNGMLYADDEAYGNEIKLLFSMGSYHPAFTFQQKEILRSKFRNQKNSNKNTTETGNLESKIADKEELVTNEIPTTSESNQESKLKKTRSSSSLGSKETSHEGIKRSPQVVKGLNEIGLSSDISSLSLATAGNTVASNNNPVTRMPMPTDANVAATNQMVEQPFHYHPLPMPAIFPSQNPSLLNMPFHSVQPMQPSLAVYPTNPRSQGPLSMQSVIVSPTTMQAKPGGVAQGPNGIIHQIFPTQMFASSAPTSPSVGRSGSEYRFATPPIPVRPTRLYRPLNQGGFNAGPQPVNYGYNMSPYQSPMDSPVTSPFTSPSPSPKSSPLPSPRLSPFPSPAESPMFRRKFPSGSLSGKNSPDQCSSVFEWLKSLRLHKYAEVFKDFTFDQMKVLTDLDLSRLGLTQGARKKFTLHINYLVERGFKGFANQLKSTDSAKCSQFSSTSSVGSLATKTGSSSDPNCSTSGNFAASSNHVGAAPSTNQGAAFLDKAGNQLTQIGGQGKQQLEDSSMKGMPIGYSPRRDEQFIEKSSDDGSQSTSESIDDLTSDDEVFVTRRPTVIENKEFPNTVPPSCYNCGAKDHFGEQCIEATMEEETFTRYGYQLNYSQERLKEKKR